MTRQDIYYHNIVYNFLACSQPKTLFVAHQINILLQNRYYLIISEKQREKKRKICVIKSKAGKTNLFNATVKEVKVKDFAVLFYYHGYIKVIIFVF